MTHNELVKRAVRWLTYAQRCGVVLSEISSAAHENPDAIGWQAHRSILVECKASRADFLAQRDKPCVKARCLVGNERYYLCEQDVIRLSDVEGTDFGLLWIDGAYVRVRRKAVHHALSPSEWGDERTMLVSALRRIRQREFLTIVPASAEETSGQEEWLAHRPTPTPALIAKALDVLDQPIDQAPEETEET